MVSLSTLLPSLVAALLVHGARKHYDLHLTDKVIAPDGFERKAEVVNDQFPGPLLTANKGDRLTVTVNNLLRDPSMRLSTSIHWHGLFQQRENDDDGVSWVTQCPISPEHEYTYELALGDQAGSFWYHSHLSTQYVDGIRGPLIIYDPHDPQKHLYDVDDATTIITLADWYHTPALKLTDDFLGGGVEPVPSSGLFNGVGMYQGGPNLKLPRVRVTKGKRYRLRLLSLSTANHFNISIEHHRMTVIEADGVAHKPSVVDSLEIGAGQRYSVVVNADQPVANYWIAATSTFRGEPTQPTNPQFNGSLTRAVLRYDGAPDADPLTPPYTGAKPGQTRFEEYKLVPLHEPSPPGGSNPPDQLLTFNFNFTGTFANKWLVNGISYESPSEPTLLGLLANGFQNASQFPQSEHVIILKKNKVVDVILNGTAGHPIHLHGHTFWVIQSASGGGPNYIDPPVRDVVLTGNSLANDQPIRIRFVTDNPGVWAIHCHIEWHLAAGFAVPLVVAPETIEETIKPNKEWDRLCRIYNDLPPSFQ